MASFLPRFNKVELSAVTSTPTEYVSFKWKVNKFKSLVDSAVDKGEKTVTSLPFNLRETLFPPEVPEVMMVWKIELDYSRNIDDPYIKLYLNRETPFSGEFYARMYGIPVYDGEEFIPLGCLRGKALKKFDKDCSGYLVNSICSTSELHQIMWESDESWKLMLEADFYVDSDEVAEILPKEEHNSGVSEVESFKARKGIILHQVASLLGDEITSDVIVSVNDKERVVEIGTFFCHSAILSERSSVMRHLLRASTEKKDGKVVVKMEEVVSLEVIDQFLTFLYSGKLKEGVGALNTRPVWVSLLPHLVGLAYKYEVADLMDFCDVHLYRAVNRPNVLEILTLANRHNLRRTLAKLQTKFSTDPYFLLHSLYR